MSEGYEVTGLDQVVRGLSGMGVEVDDLAPAFDDIARDGAQTMRGLIPRRSGRLASTATAERTKSRASVRVGSTAVPYAGPVNYGWERRNYVARNFTGRTDVAIQPRSIQRLEDEINAALRRKDLQ